MDDDLEDFIKLQKEKLSKERRGFQEDDTNDKSPRKKWDKDDNSMEEVNQQIKQALPPTRLDTPEVPIAAKLGQYEDKRKRLNEEKRQEYNQLLSRQKGSSRRGGNADKSSSSLPGLRDSQSAKARKIAERNKEYNQFLKQKKKSDSQRKNATISPVNETSLSLGEHPARPAIRDPPDQVRPRKQKRSTSPPHARKVPPLTGDDIPTLDIGASTAVRDQPHYPLSPRDTDPLGADHPGGSSLPIDDRAADLRRKQEERNREYNDFLKSKKASPASRRRVGTPETGLEFGRHQRAPTVGAGPDEPTRKGWGTPRYDDILEQKRREENQYRRDVPGIPVHYGMRPVVDGNHINTDEEASKLDRLDDAYESRKVRFRTELYGGRPGKPAILDDDDWLDMYKSPSRYEREFDNWGRANTTLNKASFQDRAERVKSAPIRDAFLVPGASAVATSREQYRLELEQQMRANAENRRREKQEGLTANATGMLDITRQFVTSPEPGKGQGRSIDAPLPAPTILQPQGSQVNGQSVMAPYSSPLDETYYYYARKDPLDSDLIQPNGYVPSIPNQSGFDARSRDMDRDRERGKAVTFGPGNNLTPRYKNQSDLVTVAAIPILTETDQKDIARTKTMSYQQELERQIVENKARKNQDDELRKRDEARLDAEIRSYNPFGKGGGGAPLKDTSGNVLADLRKMHVTNNDPNVSSRRPPEVPTIDVVSSSYDAYLSPRQQQISLDSYKSPRVQQEPTFARGGHGIFGDPKTDAEKTTADRYKIELQLQIEEKKRREEKRKADQKAEEEKDMKRMEETRIKMQVEYEEEIRKQREKKENARQLNEAAKLQAEEKRREMERQRREQDDKRNVTYRHQRDQEELDRMRLSVGLSARLSPAPATLVRQSPPVPALAKHQLEAPLTSRDHYDQAPPAPSRLDRAGSADVLTKLEIIRRQLRSERQRVENLLEKDKYEVDVFDPRLVKAAPVATVPVIMSPPVILSPVPRKTPDVFVMGAINKAPVAVKRPATEAVNADLLNEFNSYKNRDSDSRHKFRQLFPDQPTTSNALEAQQLALLRQQEENLSGFRNAPDKDDLRARIAALSEDEDGQYVKPNPPKETKETAREKRRKKKVPEPKSNIGSTTSLNSEINRKNDARLKKLRDMHDDDSLQDPDEILDRFISRQQHQRPNSGTTLNEDEAWLRPSN